MTLKEWREEQEAKLRAFNEWWLRQHDFAFADYPMSMEPGDWDEQFVGWDLERLAGG